MKPLCLLLVLGVLGVPAALAQDKAPMVQKPSSLQQNNSKNAVPDRAGGASTASPPPGADSAPAAQPETATGADLKGPPTRFPANNTPE